MDNKKTSPKFIIIFCVVICILLFGGIFLLHAVSSNNSNNENVSNSNLPEWLNYLTSFDLVLTKSVWSDGQCNFEKVNVSAEEINEIFNKISIAKITKYYYGDMTPEGTFCSNRYELKYDDKSIRLEADGVLWVDDSKLSKKIDLVISDTQGSGKGKYVYRFNINFSDVINNTK